MKIFNTLTGLATGYFLFKMTGNVKGSIRCIALFMLVFSPIYLVMLGTSLTEPLFGLFTIITIYLLKRGKPEWSAIIASLLPFLRIEGFGFILLFILLFVWMRQWKSMFLLFAGSVVAGLAGAIYHQDIWWLPRALFEPGTLAGIYGKGDFLHYIRHFRLITGLPVALFFIMGTVVSIIPRFGPEERSSGVSEKLIRHLLLTMVAIFVLGHSFAWWRGSYGSLGLIRTMTCIVPLIVYIAIAGWDFLEQRLLMKRPVIGWIASLALIGWMIFYPFSVYKIPTPLNETEKMMFGLYDQINEDENAVKKVYVCDPFFLFIDMVRTGDETRIVEGLPDTARADYGILPGERLVWDAHFSPNEYGLAFDSLLLSPYFRLIYARQPETPFEVIGGYFYEIFVFERRIEMVQPEYSKIRLYPLVAENEDMPDTINQAVTGRVMRETYVSLDSLERFTGTSLNYDSIFNGQPLRMFLSASVFVTDTEEPFSLVASFENNGVSYKYISKDSEKLSLKDDQWNDIRLEFMAPPLKDAGDELRIYVWYRGNQQIKVDSLLAEMMVIGIPLLNFSGTR